ncbi:MAG: hypothetical protein BWY95_00913 [Bacteroidetes bacterium ADurb.BinA104]|nr:MAG: hypothetical protein BWY95_00913 [Bacteroidetes bacterium ADurb.BinA104]
MNDLLSQAIREAYAETSARIEEKQESIERIVTNGLSHNVADIAKRLDIFCDEVII